MTVPNFKHLFVVLGLIVLNSNVLAQCSGFPATLTESDCSTFSQLASNQSIISGTTFGVCANSISTESFSAISLNGGIIRVCGNTIITGSFNSGTIVVQCGATLFFNSGLAMNQNITIVNYGNVEVVGDLDYQNSNNAFYNEGADSRLIVSGDVTFPQNNGQNAYLKNNGYMEIGGTFNALNGGFTCLGENSVLVCDVLRYGQNCGAPANRFTYGSGSGTAIVRYQTSATRNGNFTADASIEVHSATGSTTNGCSTFGSATLVTNASVIPDPGPRNSTCAPNCFTFLPVDLLSFSAICRDDRVSFDWTTASETNNDYFLIQYSDDLETWSDLNRVDGAGNSSLIINYTYNQLDVNEDKPTYYRLKQVDFDGTETVHEPVFLQCENSLTDIEVFPNPLSVDDGLISFRNITSSTMLSIYSALGQQYYNVVIDENKTTINVEDLPRGIYYFKMSNSNNSSVKKVIIH